MSHAVLESTKLREWCRLVLQTIENQRSREKRKSVDHRVKEINTGYFHRLFRKRDVTAEEITKQYESWSEDWDHPWWRIRFTGGRAEDVAERLMPSCMVSSHVTVSTEDLQYLNGWSPDGAVEQLFGEKGYR